MRSVVFDFGGVLMKHDREGCLNDLQQFLSDEDITHVLGFGNDKEDTLRARFETGASLPSPRSGVSARCFTSVNACAKAGFR